MTENLFTTDSIRTHSGIYFNVFEPTIEMIDIHDIAHALSNLCRFGGHTPFFYSVAQHSIEVAKLVPPSLKMQALLHDAAEAYLLDIPSPIKKRLVGYDELEDNIMKLIAKKFKFQYPLDPIIKEADKNRLQWEWDNVVLYKPQLLDDSQYYNAQEDKDNFIKTFKDILFFQFLESGF